MKRNNRYRFNAFISGALGVSLLFEMVYKSRLGWILVLAFFFSVNLSLSLKSWANDIKVKRKK